MNDIQTYIIEYIKDNTSHDDVSITTKTNFVESGLLDSFAILNLIMSLESEFSIKFQPQELAEPSLRIVETLSATVADKMA